MSQPADDKQLGEHLVSTGKLSSEELLACFEAQRLAGGPRRKRLDEILVERGHITPLEIRESLTLSPRSIEPTTPATSPTHGEDLPDHVRQALADPARRIGRYVMLNELGRGGMGVVYRCYDTQLHRDVAVKVVRTLGQTSELDLARLEREARAAAKIRHPGIVAVHEVGEHGGEPFLVMDFIEGQTFDALLESEQVPARRVVEVIREVARTLDHAHAAAITHRDVKPQNIMLDSGGRALLMDFGLARDSSAQQQLTQTGEMLGTPVYMSPEQINGADLGPWTDVYALGAVLYCGLTGAPPFLSSNTISLFRKILLDEPRSPRAHNPAITPDLETIILKCLEKEPHLRYPSAAMVADELQRYLDGKAILARPIGRGERAVRWARRNRAVSAAMLVVVVVVAGFMVSGLYLAREAEREALRREERAGIRAEKEATRTEKDRARNLFLQNLRSEVSAVLDRVQSGELLMNPSNYRIEHAGLLSHREPEAVELISAELDALSTQLTQSQTMSKEKERLLQFLCEALADLGLREGAVAALGRYLEAEITLPVQARNQLRAVPAGQALGFLSGEEAIALLEEARDGFGENGGFWGQIKQLYKGMAVVPELEAQTALGYYNRGRARLDKGDLDGAIADYNRAIELNPDGSNIWGSRGNARLDKGDIDGAIADFNRAIEIDPDEAGLWHNRGVARHDKGDLDGAIADYSRAIELDPNLETSWNSRGKSRKAKGDLDGAIADYTRAIEIDPNFPHAWNNRGNARHDKGDLDSAIADYTRAIEIDPAHALAWDNRGGARSSKGDLDGAIADYSRAIKIDPNFAGSWTNRGTAREAKGDLDGAIADHNRAIELDPSSTRAWYNRGVVRHAKGDLDGAIADYSRAIELDPSYTRAWVGRGVARHDKGALDGAIADYSRAIELDPNSTKAWDNRGLARKAKGDLDGAIADYSRSIELDPESTHSWNNRGNARSSKGDIDGAITDFSQALARDPDLKPALINRGLAYMETSDFNRSLRDLTRAIELDPTNNHYWTVRGLAFQRKGNPQAAIDDYTKAVELNPTDSSAWKNRGIVRAAMGDLEGGIADLQLFLEIAPNDRLAPAIRAEIQKLRKKQDQGGADK